MDTIGVIGSKFVVSDTTLSCAWCGKHLGNATKVTYLNGNQPVCDLCLMKTENDISQYESDSILYFIRREWR